jgi:hypothetical protein
VTPTHAQDAQIVRRAIATLAQTAEARALGIMPADAFALRALSAEQAIEGFLRQELGPDRPAATLSALHGIADKLR